MRLTAIALLGGVAFATTGCGRSSVLAMDMGAPFASDDLSIGEAHRDMASRDLAVDLGPDLATASDFAVPADLAIPDMATPPDLTPPLDLSMLPDLSPPLDFAIPPDLSPPPPDLFGVPPKRVFVTSKVYYGNMGGLTGADANCQALAQAASLSGQYKAWLSDEYNSPLTRFTKSAAPYVLVDGTVIAQDWQQLTSGTLAHAINLTELGTQPPMSPIPCDQTMAGGGVWSGTDDYGRAAQLPFGGAYCGDWTSTNFSNASWGAWEKTTAGWSNLCGFAADPPSPNVCVLQFPIYCFEQ